MMTVKEVADALRISARTVYRLIESGDLPAFRIGKQWRLSEKELESDVLRGAQLRQLVHEPEADPEPTPVRDAIIESIVEDGIVDSE